MNYVFASFSSNTGILSITQMSQDATYPPNVLVTEDAQGDILVEAGDGNTTIFGGGASTPPASILGLFVSFENNGSILNISDVILPAADLTILSGQGNGTATIENGSKFKSLACRRFGSGSVSVSPDSQIGVAV